MAVCKAGQQYPTGTLTAPEGPRSVTDMFLDTFKLFTEVGEKLV